MIRCRSETAQGERAFSRSYTALEGSPRTQRACPSSCRDQWQRQRRTVTLLVDQS